MAEGSKSGLLASRFGAAVRFPVLFLGFSLLFLFLLDGPLEDDVKPGLCRLVAVHSHYMLQLLGEDTRTYGTVVSASGRGHAYEVIYACTSLPATVLLLSAILAFPATWRRKLVGLVVGGAILYAINLLRLVVLFYCFIYWPSFYEKLHLTVWQSLLVVLAILIFWVWATWGTRRGEDAHATA